MRVSVEKTGHPGQAKGAGVIRGRFVEIDAL